MLFPLVRVAIHSKELAYIVFKTQIRLLDAMYHGTPAEIALTSQEAARAALGR